MLYVSALLVEVFADEGFNGDFNGISVVDDRLNTCGLDGRGGIELALAVGERFFIGEVRGLLSIELRFSKTALLVVTGDLYANCCTFCGEAYSLALSLGLKLDRTLPPGETIDSSFSACFSPSVGTEVEGC